MRKLLTFLVVDVLTASLFSNGIFIVIIININ
jgi:hypothetical protein